MNTKICTTTEQSKKLMELGLNIDTADMFYRDNGQDVKLMWEHLPNILITTPAWSLSALLELMPNISGETPIIKKQINGNKWACWYESWHIIKEGNTPLDAVFNMIVLLLENKKI